MRNIESGGVTAGKPKGRWSDDDDDGGDVRSEMFERFISLSKNIKNQVLQQNYHGG